MGKKNNHYHEWSFSEISLLNTLQFNKRLLYHIYLLCLFRSPNFSYLTINIILLKGLSKIYKNYRLS